MVNKLKLVFLLFIGVATNAFYCLIATQERIIPIGTSDNRLIGIEIISNRYGEGEFGENPVWDYKFTLKGFNQDYSEFIIRQLSFDKGIKGDKREDLIKSKISQALQICRDMIHFEALRPKNIDFCDFQKTCSNISLTESKEGLRFRLNSEKENYPVQYLLADYKGEIAKPYKDYFRAYFEDSDEIIGTDLKISSIRQYENSSHKLLIFHLATGQEFTDLETGNFRKKKQYKFDRELIIIEDTNFNEPILHHGKGFDFFRMDEK